MNQLISVTITGPDDKWLAAHTKDLVERRLAACGNITPNVRSIYSWDGSIEDDSEAQVVLHTRMECLQDLIKHTNERHPYDTAQILAVQVVGVDPDYKQWVIDQTSTSKK